MDAEPDFDRVKPAARLFVDAPLAANATIELDRDRAHYLQHVLRLSPGATIEVFNGRDGGWACAIESFAKRGAILTAQAQRRAQVSSPDLWLCFAPLKRARIDLVVEKATELGVSRLLPVETRRTVTDRVNLDRLRAIASEAAEQCERLDVPVIDAPVTLPTLLGNWDATRTLHVAAESGAAQPLHVALAPAPCAFLIGPEGGFDPAELDLLRSVPFVVAIGLGPRLLRAETAALAALASWQALRGDGSAADQRPPFRE
ncbi:16S rRNA (uracil(1498)-N(3))-methyltransferase [Roseiterribacter gracilis]|uniref:Ribosomal RNA small subunit methyltransferase E n=1 Tax=Roseiterribacter gracilis TaxID=2812848 RepID=A0A8S8XGE1_9PROT|nr:ribosomal RNA small subunit methyltransferase E [Rhodospirillales bacterium TMPK1]